MREVFWLLDKNDHKGCLKVLEPEIRGSLKEDGTAQSAYGLLLTDFHRYDEARYHLKDGLKISPYGYFSSDARAYLEHLPEKEAEYRAIRAQGAGSVGLVLKDNVVRRVIPASPAASARMLAGDKLLTVDSKTVSSANFPGLAKYLRGKVGSVVTLIELAINISRWETGRLGSCLPNFLQLQSYRVLKLWRVRVNLTRET